MGFEASFKPGQVTYIRKVSRSSSSLECDGNPFIQHPEELSQHTQKAVVTHPPDHTQNNQQKETAD